MSEQKVAVMKIHVPPSVAKEIQLGCRVSIVNHPYESAGTVHKAVGINDGLLSLMTGLGVHFQMGDYALPFVTIDWADGACRLLQVDRV